MAVRAATARATLWANMRLILLSLTVFALLLAHGARSGAQRADAAPVEPSAQAQRATELYRFSCSTCHGDTGLGFAEAVSAFPEDHRYCAQCHHPQNSATMPGSQIGLSTMAFSLGDPPPLNDPERLERFVTAGALYHYIRAAMPRWAPGSLDDEVYLDLTSHLLRLVGVMGEDETLTHEALDGFRLE